MTILPFYSDYAAWLKAAYRYVYRNGIAWAVLADPQKAWQTETRPNRDVPAANATKTEWDPTLVQPEEEDEVEKQQSRKMQCLPTRRCGDVCETPSPEHLSINFDKTDF